MWQVLGFLAVLMSVTLTTGAAAADSARQPESRRHLSPFMRVSGPSLPPYGYLRFCSAFPDECKVGRMEETRIAANAEHMRELQEVNKHVNHTIAPATDLEIFGELERWTLPTDRGDCEDYALLKRHILMERGWPASALLMTVVRDEKGEGHAVLTARTAKGDFILDNKTDEMRLWYKTPYAYVMRQSYIDPNVWLSLDASEEERSPALLGGVRGGR
jgi:predicted transglutaminase-like cysteine proteinase